MNQRPWQLSIFCMIFNVDSAQTIYLQPCNLAIASACAEEQGILVSSSFPHIAYDRPRHH